jgi:hypothetical protein
LISKGFLKEANLDPQRIEKDMTVSRDLAVGYETWAPKLEGAEAETAFAISASFYRRAASHALLLGHYGPQGKSREMDASQLFSRAASVYARLGMPYARFIAVLKEGSGSSLGSIEQLEHPENVQPEMIYLLLAEAMSPRKADRGARSMSRVIRTNLEAFRSHPIGLLGFRIGSYLDLVDSLDKDASQRSVSFEEAALPFVEGYNSAVRQAMHNDYHWRRLSMPFHPAEPDVFAVLLSLDRAMRASDKGNILAMVDSMPLAWESKSFLSGILVDYRKTEPHLEEW